MNSALAAAISKDHMNHRRASDNEQKRISANTNVWPINQVIHYNLFFELRNQGPPTELTEAVRVDFNQI